MPTLLVLLASTGCVMQQGRQMELDFLGYRERFYVYQKPPFRMLNLRPACLVNPGWQGERQPSHCVMTYLRRYVRVPWIVGSNFEAFTRYGRADDLMQALADVQAGGTTGPPHGEWARRWVVGDHRAFGANSWTWRGPGDAHCTPGAYPR